MIDLLSKVAVWYHGAQEVLTIIREGSSITPYQQVAVAFSHRPEIVSMEDDGSVRHNGTAHGYLHRVIEDLMDDDLVIHPACKVGEDWEWVVTRDIQVELIADYDVDPSFHLTAEAIQKIKEQRTKT